MINEPSAGQGAVASASRALTSGAMMIALEEGLYLRVLEQEGGPRPRPLESSFNLNTAYRALGAVVDARDPTLISFVLSNDQDEILVIDSWHLRTVAVNHSTNQLRLPIAASRESRWESE